MHDFFKKLTVIENGNYSYNNKYVASGIGIRSPYDIYKLDIKHNNHLIKTINEIGLRNVGSFSSIIFKTKKLSKFSIATRNPLFMLLYKKNNGFTIKCPDSDLKNFIINNKSLRKISIHAYNTQFDILIKCKLVNNEFHIVTEYNLIFENRNDVIIQLIEFYKNLIDFAYNS